MGKKLADAYVQIIPVAKGIKGQLTATMNSGASAAGNSAGSLMGKGLASKLISIVAAAQIGQKIISGITTAINEGGALEQSLGGIETLFKDSSDIVIQNAQRAFQTAGMSANAYMESVTGFSASLLQGLAGDTNAAATVADMALTDMSDNANKMGTSMELIQNAYQGFAKQNYTMLDNLKLGYGGTKTEMERLLADAQKLTGVEYNIDNLADVYSAIHAVQEELGITGTTALEASTTLVGSSAAMKSAWSNLAAYMTTGEGDVAQAVTDALTTSSTYLFGNLLPMLGNMLASLPEALGTAFVQMAPQIQESGMKLITFLQSGVTQGLPNLLKNADAMLGDLLNKITEALPGLLEKGKEIVTNIATGYLETIPKVITNVGSMLTKIVDFIGKNLPKVWSAGADILIKIRDGIVNNLPDIVTAIASVMMNIVTSIAKNLPNIYKSGIEIIAKIAAGVIEAIPKIIAAIPKVVKAIVDKIQETDWKTTGKNIIQGIAEGLKSAGSILAEAAKNAGKAALDAIKEALGIHSPSVVFEKEVGQMIDLGIAEGISKNTKAVQNSMKALSAETVGGARLSFVSSAQVEDNYNTKSNVIDYDKLGNAVVTAFVKAGLTVRIDGRELGRVIGGYL